MPSELTLETTAIPGLLVVHLPVHGDARGWFKENWQRAKMTALGLPDFGPVQHNVAFNGERGVTRGFHAEPWDKFVSIVHGKVFGAWVDLREGETYGTVVTHEIDPETAIFVPRGVANSYQVLEDGSIYSYLVNDHWSAAAKERYSMVSLADPTLGVEWPIPLDRAILSDADRTHPAFADATPVAPKKTLVLGAHGQLGRALVELLPDAIAAGRDEIDITDPAWTERVDLSDIDVIVNAAAYTAVDAAETGGRADAWGLNAVAVARLVEAARAHRITLVHVSSDYVFDGTRKLHGELEPLTPLSVYGQTKAAGDIAVREYERHYLVRTSWVVGDGGNFVKTMASLADRGIAPSVVDDQHGRLTFATDLAAGIVHLLRTRAPFGTYNLSNGGPTQTWADIAADVYELRGKDRAMVTPVSTETYYAGKTGIAPRPTHSTLDLARIEATGFTPPPAAERLAAYVAALPAAE